jgi:hypothetical protein
MSADRIVEDELSSTIRSCNILAETLNPDDRISGLEFRIANDINDNQLTWANSQFQIIRPHYAPICTDWRVDFLDVVFHARNFRGCCQRGPHYC